MHLKWQNTRYIWHPHPVTASSIFSKWPLSYHLTLGGHKFLLVLRTILTLTVIQYKGALPAGKNLTDKFWMFTVQSSVKVVSGWDPSKITKKVHCWCHMSFNLWREFEEEEKRKKEGTECTTRTDIRKEEILAAGETCMAIFWMICPGEGTKEGWGCPGEGL